MSWLDRTFITEFEALNKADVPSTQFSPGDRVYLGLGELGDREGGPFIEGVITGVNFDADQVKYNVAFPIKNSDIWVNVKCLRNELIRKSDGERTTFISMDELDKGVAECLHSNRPALTLVPDGDNEE